MAPGRVATIKRNSTHVVDEMFSDDEMAITNAVVVVQGGRVLCERYGGEQFYFDRPAEPITRESQLLSWSTAKSMLHMIIGTLVDEGRLESRSTGARSRVGG